MFLIDSQVNLKQLLFKQYHFLCLRIVFCTVHRKIVEVVMPHTKKSEN